MFGGIWHHHKGNRWAGDLCEQCMSPEERRLIKTPVENLAADRFVGEQLGGVDHTLGLVGDEPRHH